MSSGVPALQQSSRVPCLFCAQRERCADTQDHSLAAAKTIISSILTGGPFRAQEEEAHHASEPLGVRDRFGPIPKSETVRRGFFLDLVCRQAKQGVRRAAVSTVSTLVSVQILYFSEQARSMRPSRLSLLNVRLTVSTDKPR